MDPNDTSAQATEQEEIARQFDAIVAAERWSLDITDIDLDMLRAARLVTLLVLSLVVLTMAYGLVAISLLAVLVASVAVSEWSELSR